MKLITHDGTFHADEVFAIAFLQTRFGNFEVVRTRDVSVVGYGDIAVDVGGMLDPGRGFFDHHQREGAGKRDNGIPYSSFGLVWKQFGLDHMGGDYRAFEHVDKALVQGIDAVDCGAITSTHKSGGVDVSIISLSGVISAMNPGWGELYADTDLAFARAVRLAKSVLKDAVLRAKADGWARELVAEAVLNSADRILVLEQYCLWQRHLAELDDTILYVVFPDDTSGTWRVECVPEVPGSMASKKPFPIEWHGCRNDTLDDATGVMGGVFCHRNGFIMGHETREGAEQLAYDAVQS